MAAVPRPGEHRGVPGQALRRWRVARPHVASVAVIVAVAALLFAPLARRETFVDVASEMNVFAPWKARPVPASFPIHYDQADSFFPWQVFLNDTLRDGELPYWNPYSFGGHPFLANGQNGTLYPLRTALSFVAPPAGYTTCWRSGTCSSAAWPCTGCS
ncbi:MAG: hypothetical protein M5U14_13755 [Acidimicrobiia bacterium]|nr:hypothetical protein [Acidimicrobiia bacterium]